MLVIFSAILWFVGAIFDGFVLSTLWKWFIIPTFPGAPQLGIVAAIGLGLIVGCLTFQGLPNRERSNSDLVAKLAEMFGESISYSVFALAFGWITHFFM